MDKTLSMLGICRKSGRLLPGHDIAINAVKSSKAEMIILTADASARHEKELEALKFTGTIRRLKLTSAELAPAVGKNSCIFAVTDSGFARAIDKKIHEEGIQYGS